MPAARIDVASRAFKLRQNLGAVGWRLTPEQVATLDAASTVSLPYSYWHQRGFAERNPELQNQNSIRPRFVV